MHKYFKISNWTTIFWKGGSNFGARKLKLRLKSSLQGCGVKESLLKSITINLLIFVTHGKIFVKLWKQKYFSGKIVRDMSDGKECSSLSIPIDNQPYAIYLSYNWSNNTGIVNNPPPQHMVYYTGFWDPLKKNIPFLE